MKATVGPGRMTPALECFRNAARCEQQAAAAVAANRAVLLAIAEDWRERGRLAQAEEAASSTRSGLATPPKLAMGS
jgi:hypothetical protein